MRTFVRTISITIVAMTAASAVFAQPGGPRRADGPGPRPAGGASPTLAAADFLLAHTGDLALTDAQVVRLAAISRRVDARRKALASRADSARSAERSRPDSAGGPGRRPPGPPPAERQQMRDQQRMDVRDAIAVLTAEQQATAWMMIAGRGPLGGGPDGPARAFGAGAPQDDGAGAPDRGPISRPPGPRDVPRRPGAEPVTP